MPLFLSLFGLLTPSFSEKLKKKITQISPWNSTFFKQKTESNPQMHCCPLDHSFQQSPFPTPGWCGVAVSSTLRNNDTSYKIL